MAKHLVITLTTLAMTCGLSAGAALACEDNIDKVSQQQLDQRGQTLASLARPSETFWTYPVDEPIDAINQQGGA